MKVLLVIDGLGGGGAQRQIVHLANGLHERGVQVELFFYHRQETFFQGALQVPESCIHSHGELVKGFSWRVVRDLRRLIRAGRFTSVVSYLDSPSIYAILASTGLGVNLVVSDRNSHKNSSELRMILLRQLYRLADYVVPNSFSQGSWLEARAHLPKNKIRPIWNGFPAPPAKCISRETTRALRKNHLKVVGVGRICAQKNIGCLARAARLYLERTGNSLEVSWAGRVDDRGLFTSISKELALCPEVEQAWRWLGPVSDVDSLIASSHVLVLPSHYEGLPNAVCEAFICGRPAIAADVGDHRLLLTDGTGFLFKSDDANDLCEQLLKLSRMLDADYESMCTQALGFARERLSISRMIDEYMLLLK